MNLKTKNMTCMQKPQESNPKTHNKIHIAMCHCRNPSLGLATKARACKGTGQEGSPGVTSHAPRSVGEGEEMNTSK